MKTSLTRITVKELCDCFVYNELEGKGLYGLSGRLTIQPEYQRSYIYAEAKMDAAVIESLLLRYPLGLLYFNKLPDGSLEVLDGQQRITSIGRFLKDHFAVELNGGMPQYFSGLSKEDRDLIESTEMLAYECEGPEKEIKDWFRTINIAGIPLNFQELLNAVYSGPFVREARKEFSNSSDGRIARWRAFVKGSATRQDFLATALAWVSKDAPESYLAINRNNPSIAEIKNYFSTVIAWAEAIFPNPEKEMRGLPWGEYYEKYGNTPHRDATADVERLYADPYVKNRRGVFEYILGGQQDTKLLEVRLFDEATKQSVYRDQTTAAKASGISNCPDCAAGHDSNRDKIWEMKEMDADHVTPWSKGGATTKDNCQMLCRRHNQAKGNK